MARAQQTVLVKKSLAPTRRAASKVARRHADRIYTSRQTKNYWRFRQRPPSCFSGSFRTEKRADGVLVVYGTLKKDAKGRRACR